MAISNYDLIRKLINRDSGRALHSKKTDRNIYQILTNADDIALGTFGQQLVNNGLLSGTVTWVSGLTFLISECSYVIDGVVYNSPSQTVTLSAADGTHPRIDVFYADDTGVSGVLEGSAAADPIKPVIDPTTQVEISFATIEASATTPTGVANTVVYDEDDDWTATVALPGVDKAATANPAAGTKHIQFSEGSTTTSSYVQLTNSSALSLAAFDKLTFQLYNRTLGGKNRKGLIIELYLGNDVQGSVVMSRGDYGFTTQGQYETVSIPVGDFSGVSQFDAIRFRAAADGAGFDLDNIYLQGGQGNTSPGNVAYTDVSNAWSKQQSSPLITLTDAATIDIDLSLGNVFEVTLDGNRTIDFTNATPGQHFTMIIKQDATTGGRTLTWDAANDWAGGTAPTLSTATSAVDVLSFVVDSAGNIHGSLGIADSK